MPLVNRLKSLSVSKIMLLVTVLVAMLPLAILGVHLYNSAWKNSWREIEEKHQLLARNMATPISTYVSDHRAMLNILTETLPATGIEKETARPLLSKTLSHVNGFRSLVLMDVSGNVIIAAGNVFKEQNVRVMANNKAYRTVLKSAKWWLSDVMPHPITGKPSLFMGDVVRNKQNVPIAVLLAELKIDYIEKLRSQVKFGNKGHSAIVDKTGHVIAHPNKEWMAETKDISSWPIVKNMMAGKTGVTTFYSPFMQGNMVAGYASVPEFGWGIMVPQPESEVAEQVNTLMHSHFIWGGIGLIVAIILAILLSRWVTHPLHKLTIAGHSLMKNRLDGNLPAVKNHSPKEITQLAAILRTLISSLQSSRKEVEEFNKSLQQRVEAATSQLRDANSRLEEAAQSDYLTELANRRYFEDCLQQVLSRRSGDVDQFCVMLIDIDHFKQINDTYGHAAGDMVLNQVARILENSMRSGDLVARYGGDEFVAYMRCNRDIGLQRAAEMRTAIEKRAVQWNGKSIHITASVGMCSRRLNQEMKLDDVLHFADEAMYMAKRQGRNRVIDLAS